ncbi:MAG: hypothetical protein NTW85_16575 [Methylococcales bacterium]|nr:hypothetical protein [Methylococcales bacterium]
MKKINKTPLAAAMGVAFMSTFAVTTANAEANPFGISELSQGYMQVAEAEMKCGANMKMDDSNAKMPEGACAGKKAADSEKPADTKAADAKPAEGSCGNMMEDGKMKKGMEAVCGEMMKGKEGACGMMQSGDSMKGKESAAGESAKTDATAKAPEASCGGMMEDGKMKKGMEASCGAMMKGKEGACGMMSSGDTMKSKEGSCGAAMKAPEDKTAGTANKPSSGTKIVPYVPAAK